MTIRDVIKNPWRPLSFLAMRGLFDWMPDEPYVKMMFRSQLGKKLDLKNPHSFNEKLQWLKLFDRAPLYTQLVDKYEVRKHVAETIGAEYLIPLVGGPWNSFDEINFNALPDQFVLKCTHDSGGLVICRDKNKLDVGAAKKKIERSLQKNYYRGNREWPYKNVKPRIIAEAYMEDENYALGLTDYKFFCFHNTPKMIYISQGLEDHSTASISFYDLEGREMPFHRSDFKPIVGEVCWPQNFSEMLNIAKRLAESVNCPFVRIDLYSIHGKTFFSEVTFTPCAGMIPFEPRQWDDKLGEWLILPNEC